MLTSFARHKGNGSHTEAHAETLDEALCHLNELIISEPGDPDGPLYWTYGIEFDPKLAKAVRPLRYHHPNLKPAAGQWPQAPQHHAGPHRRTIRGKKREKRLLAKAAG